MENKKFLTYEEQINLLKSKGLKINNDMEAVEQLKQHSYFDLINGYKYPFKTTDGKYKTNSSFNDICALYNFDDEIRYVLLKRIMEVEIHIKSLLSYSFCEKFGEAQHTYLNTTNYNYANASNQFEINKLIQIITGILNDNKSFTYMRHQKEIYNNIPLWVLVKAMTFGNISRMYNYQLPQIQTRICKEFIGVNENALASFLDLLTRFRNVCAHNERLFDYKYNKRSIVNTDMHEKLKIPKKNGKYTKGRSDLFSAIIALKYLLPHESFASMLDDIKNSVEKLSAQTNQIQRQQLYKYMGMPNNWYDIRNISL